MTEGRRPPEPPDDEVVFLEDGGDDVERALADAERAVTAVAERQRQTPADNQRIREEGRADSGEKGELSTRISLLERELAEQRERALLAEEEAGRLREVLLRKTADSENLKRRTEKEKTEYFKFALAETFRDLLEVLDNFERATLHAALSGSDTAGDAPPSGDYRAGIGMIARQLAETLRRYGLVEVPAQGLPFDPNVHEAVMREETETASSGTVLEVLKKGYVLNDRLLRPALVKVAAGSSRSPENGS